MASTLPVACSGGMYAGVPRTAPSCVRSASGLPAGYDLARPLGRDALAHRHGGRCGGRSAGCHGCQRCRGSLLRFQHLGQAPVHDVDLAEVADHDVGRLQVAVDHAARMGIGQGIADADEDVQQPAQRVFLLGCLRLCPQLVQTWARLRPLTIFIEKNSRFWRRRPVRGSARCWDVRAAGDLGFLDEAELLAGVGLVEQVLDGDLAADVAVDGPQDGAHAAAGDFLLDDVAPVFLGPQGQEFAGRISGQAGQQARWLQGDAAIDAGLGEAAVAVPSIWPAATSAWVWSGGRHDQRLLAGRAPGRAAGELRFDLELHAAVRAGEGDHGGPRGGNRRGE